MQNFIQDLKLSFRTTLRRPLFFLVAAGSLTVGIGANTAIFSAANRLLLRPPDGIPEPERVVELGAGRSFGSWSYPDFLDLRAEAHPLEALAGYDMQQFSLSQGEAGVRVFGLVVSANYFEVLGVAPAQGRFFLPDEDEGLGEHRVAVVSHNFWMNALGGDPGVVGTTLQLNRETFEVVGVTKEGFQGHLPITDPAIWVPMMAYPLLQGTTERFERRGTTWFQLLGRLREGTSVEQAQTAVNTVMQRLADEYPETNSRRTGAVKKLSAVGAEAFTPIAAFMAALMGLVVFILLITCANVAGMFLARASSRQKELAIRLSLGSGRRRLIGNLLTESFLVFLAGGIGGVVAAYWGLDIVRSIEIPAPMPVDFDFTPDTTVLGFALVLTLGTGLVFGLLPALQATRMDLVPTLKDEGDRKGSSSNRLRRFFVMAQVGLSMVLLVSAGLFLRSLQVANRIETGFEAEGTFRTALELDIEGYGEDEGRIFQQQLLDRLATESWIESAALASDLPLDLSRSSTTVVPEGGDWERDEDQVQVDFARVSPDYFRTLRIPVLDGRPFQATDNAESERVAVVSRAWVDQVWPGEPVVGRRIQFWGDESVTIVGVVEDTKNQMVTDELKPMMYTPLGQEYNDGVEVVVRSDLPPATVASELRRVILETSPSISLMPVVDMVSFTQVSLMPQRIAAWLSSFMGALALILSGMGIYGVIAHSVGRRTREIGIRMALGAEQRSVLRLVLRGGLRLAAPGLAVGIVLALGLAKLLQTFLLGLSPLDPITLVGVALVLFGMVVVATLVPARRAAGIHPAEALRYE